MKRVGLGIGVLGLVALRSILPAYAADERGSQSSVTGGAASHAVRFDRHILVDQFGYRPGDPKVAVIRDPRAGYDTRGSFTPGDSYEVRRSDDGKTVFSGRPVAWNHGAVEASSGDRGWWFDFSAVKDPGHYFVLDVTNELRSATFSIDERVYADVLKAATRMYFYQRSGFAKAAPAAGCWQDAAAYVGAGQDLQAHDITDPGNRAKVRDVSGGWFDAGDTNKYVTNAIRPVHQLLTAYQHNPRAFGDDFKLPESGNGVPDLLDEVKWETDWLKKMQYPDGSAALKVGVTAFVKASPPSSDSSPRFYVPSCSSATIAVAGMFAHAAYVYRDIAALRPESGDLQSRAVKAWNQYSSLDRKQEQCDSGAVKVAGSDLKADEQQRQAVVAAVYLYATTGGASYNDYIKAHYQELHPYHDIGWSRYNPEQGQALLFYATLPNADPQLRDSIVAAHGSDVRAGNQVYGFSETDDLYRSFLHEGQYHWGSNEVRADYGNTNMDAVIQGSATDPAALRMRALDTLHYFHGVNPFGKVYLSNMYSYGATTSVNELFHAWFKADCNRMFCTATRWSDALNSACGPAPGYLPGGPVANIVAAGVPASLVPPAGQPAQKSYSESSRDDPDKAYMFNEPSIVYQAAYVQLLSQFVP
jgi:endoglucanase